MFKSFRHTRFSLISISALLSISCSPETPPPETTAIGHPENDISASDITGDEHERIEAILAQNRAKRQGITSYQMDLAWEERRFDEVSVDAPLPAGKVDSYGEGTWMWRGDMWRVHRPKQFITPLSGKLPGTDITLGGPQPIPKEFLSWAVFNGEYYANYSEDYIYSLGVYPRQYLASSDIDPELELSPHPLKWGFGTGSAYVDVEYHKPKRDSKWWELTEFTTDDGPKFKLTRYMERKKGPLPSVTEFIIDPERDFLVVGGSLSIEPPEKTFEYQLELAQLANGRWFPSKVVKRRRDRIQTWRISNVKFNVELSPDLFTIESLGFDPFNTIMHQHKENGKRVPYLFRDGQWIPESSVPKERRPKGPDISISSRDRGTP